MSVYQGKLLELESISNEFDKYFLNVRLSFKQDFKMSWKIDEYTAEKLNSAIQFDGQHKYRLSFNSFWDPIHKQYTSTIAKTYRDQSERIYFLCSEDYVNKLNTIKHCQHISEVDKLTFTFRDTETINKQPKEQEESEKYVSEKYIYKLGRTSVAIISVILVMLLGYLSRVYLNKTVFDEKVLAQSIQLNDGLVTEEKEILDLKDAIIIEDFSSSQSDVPFTELSETITYGVPEGQVALTFDDGPSQYSAEIVDILKKYGAGGTFFLAGYNVEKYPDYVQYIMSNDYSIGSHSMNHARMTALSYEEQKKEIVESIKLIEEITNGEIVLFRPPYGSFNEQIKDLITENQHKMVLWNNDPEDWRTRDADEIFNNIQNSNVSGSIILLHESQAVIDALPRIIEYLQEQNLKITSLK